LLLVAFIVPVALYCFLLAVLNRSRHPVLVPGTWDFVGILCAASGFLLLGGPAILTELYEGWRVPWLLGRTHFLPALATSWYFWIGLWRLYFVIVLGGAAWMLRRRRSVTSIYNIDAAGFEAVLAGVLERLGLQALRTGPRRLVLHLCDRGSKGGQQADPQGVPSNAAAGDQPLLSGSALLVAHPVRVEVEPFAMMRHVTLRWPEGGSPIRAEVETELAKALGSGNGTGQGAGRDRLPGLSPGQRFPGVGDVPLPGVLTTRGDPAGLSTLARGPVKNTGHA
jgi:hypothetical protein